MGWSNGRLKGLSTRLRKDFNFRRAQETIPALRWLNPKSGERILDVGCGEGTYNYRIALRGAHIVGFDMNQCQLRRAMALHKTPATEFICADATTLPIQSGQFDTVMSLCVFEHLPNDREALREISRVLRPEGRILLTLDSLSLAGVDESWRDTHRKRHAVRQFYTHQAISDLLKENGFHLERYRYLLRSNIDFLLIKLSYAAEKMHPVPAALTRLWLVTSGRFLSAVCNLFTPNTRGWTLLIEARRVKE